jgi:hypothetical protein
LWTGGRCLEVFMFSKYPMGPQNDAYH